MHIISIGNELLYGKTLNTNAAFIAEQLFYLGITVDKTIVIGDNPDQILKTLAESFAETDLIITTGGLGPTKDDMTKNVLARYFELDFEIHENTLIEVIKMFKARGGEASEINRKQAEVPRGAIVFQNKNGTAPGLCISKNEKTLIALQGVPFEMQAVMLESVVPYLRDNYKNIIPSEHLNIVTSGIGESALSDLLEKWELALPEHFTLAYLPSPGQVLLRLTGRGKEKNILLNELTEQFENAHSILEPYLVSTKNESVTEVISKILKHRKKRLAVMESCTGGYLSHLITALPGSSQFFEGGLISYSNEIKRDILNVREVNIKKHGAVSEMVVTDMAINGMGLFDVDYTIAVSGVAGPAGGTEEKPIGLVWIAVASTTRVITQNFLFGKNGGRDVIIKRAAYAALNMLRLELLK